MKRIILLTFCSSLFLCSLNILAQNNVDTINYPDGSKYIGNMLGGKYNGFGTLFWANGHKYVGNWIQGQRTGEGIMFYSDGYISAGTFIDGQLNGIGYTLNKEKNIYLGEYEKDQLNGLCYSFRQDGRVFFGEAKNNKISLEPCEKFSKPEFKLVQPPYVLPHRSAKITEPKIQDNWQDLSKTDQIRTLLLYFSQLKQYNSNIVREFEKEEAYYRKMFAEIDEYTQTTANLNWTMDKLLEKKRERIESQKQENQKVVAEIKTIASDNNWEYQIKSPRPNYSVRKDENKYFSDNNIGSFKLYDLNELKEVDTVNYQTTLEFKKNKKGEIQRLLWQIDSVKNVINSMKFKHYDELNLSISALDIYLEQKDEVLNDRLEIYSEYNSLSEEFKDLLSVTEENQKVLNELKSKSLQNEASIELASNAIGVSPNSQQVAANLKSVKIGNQIWSTENLNVDRFRNGDLIPEAKTHDEWKKAGLNKQPAWCYYNNDPTNGAKYGRLYNYYAIIDPRGLAPEGWHVPTDFEFLQLTDYLGDEIFERYKNTFSAKVSEELVKKNGLNLQISAGTRTMDNGFIDRGTSIWTSTEINNWDVVVRGISRNGDLFTSGIAAKWDGRYLRFIKDNLNSKNDIQKIDSKNIRIGSQIWSTENLNVDRFRNGDPILYVKTKAEWEAAIKKEIPAYCYYNFSSANGIKYGKMYNFYAVHDPRGLAPLGWHVPTDFEWIQLDDFLKRNNLSVNTLKTPANWLYNANQSNDEIGFNALPGGESGCFSSSICFYGIGSSTGWWAARKKYKPGFMHSFGTNVTLDSKINRTNGVQALYVRCVKD